MVILAPVWWFAERLLIGLFAGIAPVRWRNT
jgi:hypothetical protein